MSVSEMARRQYLKAMGIQAWELRQDGGHVALASVLGSTGGSGVRAEDSPQTVVAGHDSGTTDLGDVAAMDWRDLEAAVRQCVQCPLHASRTQAVFGTGNRNAEWLFVGEAPGFEEDRRGEPFVGRAGQLLNAMLFALGLQRTEVFIANVLKCRPPKNRDPMGEEVVQCEPYLHRQVKLIKPGVIVALGRFAAQSLLRTNETIGRLRGRRFVYADTDIPLIVSYHPAYLLRSPTDKSKAWDDLCLAKSVLGAA